VVKKKQCTEAVALRALAERKPNCLGAPGRGEAVERDAEAKAGESRGSAETAERVAEAADER
jgi:hypothetical protein